MKTTFGEIFDERAISRPGDVGMNQLLASAKQEKLTAASEDQVKTLLLAIDMQNDFMEDGQLAVPGSHGDVLRTARFIYNHLEKITQIAVSLDTHHLQQIFHPAWWIDQGGNHPAPFTIITADDVEKGVWRAVRNTEESLEYVTELERTSKKALCIWPYHCLEGTFGAALEPQLANMIYFHSAARDAVIRTVIKGKDPLSEMYGIIKPEYDRGRYCDSQLLQDLAAFDQIIIAGEAKSHCVLESVRQIAEHYANRPDITSRMIILEDCMSCIPGFEETTERAFANFSETYGIKLVKSTEFVW